MGGRHLSAPIAENMKVKSLIIQSFRGIEELTLDFDPKVNVLIGVNGVGKSSILDCLCILMSWFTNRIQNSSGSGRFFNESDIQKRHHRTINKVIVLWHQEEITWSRSYYRKLLFGPSGRNRASSSEELENLQLTVRKFHKQFEENSGLSIPVIVHYPTNRAVLDIPLRIRKKHNFSRIGVYENALMGGRIEFRTFFEWFRNREDLENEIRLEDRFYKDCQLEAIRKVFPQFLPGFSELRVRRSPLRMTVKKQLQELIINQLSDGEKCLLAMVGDLARRLAIANPGLDDPLQGEGVVLIDEIELHLHPQWQRGILPKLTTTFPNCQFIVTTHSPQVISDVKPENIIILEATALGEVTVRHPQSSYGRDSNQILEDIMDVPQRPQHIQDEIQQLFRLIAMGHLENARNLHDNLAAQIGLDEPELVGARAAIQRKELLGK
jgi:predicted ATP-binding protein involved in virulence